MRHSVGSARDKHRQRAGRGFQLAVLLRYSKPAVVGSTADEKPESDSPESQSGGCEQSLWAVRAKRSDARTPSLSESSVFACRRGPNPSRGKGHVLDRRPTSGDWKWQPDGCSDLNSATPAWDRRKQALRRPPSRDDADDGAVLRTVAGQQEPQPGRPTVASCCAGGV